MTATQIEAILTLLARSGVEFVVVGGVAGLAHGSARITYDIDVCYRRTPENIARVCETLEPLHPVLRGAPSGLPFRLDPWTGRRELWKEIPPADNKAGGQISRILFSADGKTCVYTRIRETSYLVLAEGLK